jgi:hypothetical protein
MSLIIYDRPFLPSRCFAHSVHQLHRLPRSSRVPPRYRRIRGVVCMSRLTCVERQPIPIAHKSTPVCRWTGVEPDVCRVDCYQRRPGAISGCRPFACHYTVREVVVDRSPVRIVIFLRDPAGCEVVFHCRLVGPERVRVGHQDLGKEWIS